MKLAKIFIGIILGSLLLMGSVHAKTLTDFLPEGLEIGKSIPENFYFQKYKIKLTTNTMGEDNLLYYVKFDFTGENEINSISSQMERLGADDYYLGTYKGHYGYIFTDNKNSLIKGIADIEYKRILAKTGPMLSSLTIHGKEYVEKLIKDEKIKKEESDRQIAYLKGIEEKVKKDTKQNGPALLKMPFGIQIGKTTIDEIENRGVCIEKIKVSPSYFRCQKIDISGKFHIFLSQNEIVNKIYFDRKLGHVFPKNWRKIGLTLSTKRTSLDEIIEIVYGMTGQYGLNFSIENYYYDIKIDKNNGLYIVRSLTITEEY